MVLGAAAGMVAAAGARAQDARNLPAMRGALLFSDPHPNFKTLQRFQELTKAYYGKPVSFTLYSNAALGEESDYFAYMRRGTGLDFAIVAPANMSALSRIAPLLDAPFLFRDRDHWTKVIDGGLLTPLADQIEREADVLLVGFSGGGVRNMFAPRPYRSLAELKDVKIRLQPAPIWSRVFAAIGMSPIVTGYQETAAAIGTGLVGAAENQAAGVEAMKFYEVAPNLILTQHSITVRPICFSAKVFKSLPGDLQQAIRRAGTEASAFGRAFETEEDEATLKALEANGKLKRIPFPDRVEMRKLAEPVLAAYAKEIGAEAVLDAINGVR
jgi:TRAP-type transport system periplasmic protein